MPYLFIFLFLNSSMLHSQELRKLETVHSLKFGMKESEVISQIKKLTDNDISTTERNLYSVLRISLKDNSNFNQLRAFLSQTRGLFAIEQELFIYWNHQIDNQENHEALKDTIGSVMNRLQKKHGKEDLFEDIIFGNRKSEFRHVSASWRFADDKWIHLIYEPQDWSLYPELMKIVVVYRNSSLDPRIS